MIQVLATLSIIAVDDAEADAVLKTLMSTTNSWPDTPVVQVNETSREIMREV